jgi:hypothetical protein
MKLFDLTRSGHWPTLFLLAAFEVWPEQRQGLGSGIRLTDFISLGVLGRFIPVELVRSVLERLGRQLFARSRSISQRKTRACDYLQRYGKNAEA